MMNCLLFNQQTRGVTSGDIKLIERWEREPGSIIWLDMTGALDDQDQDLLCEHFKLHPLAVSDARRDRHPPKVEAFDDHTFVLFKALADDTVDINFSTIQLAMFIGERFFITRSSGPSPSKEKLWNEIAADPSRLIRGPDALAVRLMRLFVDRYLGILLKLEPKLETMEEGLLDSTDDEVLAELTGYKTELKKLRRIFLYHEHILRELTNREFPGIGHECKHELTDVYEHQERGNSLTLLYYELASDLIEGYLSLSSHRLNQVMKILTIITAVFVPLSFLAGIYGMNFEYMPELHSRSGYFILLSVMAGIATLLLYLFRRRAWL